MGDEPVSAQLGIVRKYFDKFEVTLTVPDAVSTRTMRIRELLELQQSLSLHGKIKVGTLEVKPDNADELLGVLGARIPKVIL